MTLKQGTVPSSIRLRPGQSTRPALTRLAMLAAANPVIANTLLHNPVAAASLHPHYPIMLDAIDRAILVEIQSRSRTINDFLTRLAVIIDDEDETNAG
jgi:hypothetical protein